MRVVSGCALLIAALAAATAASVTPPTIDGIITREEWAGARHEPLIGGGEVLLLRAGSDLYVAVSGTRPGYPSLCVGDAAHVEVLHASAALGTVSYTRTSGAKTPDAGQPSPWRLRGGPFEWRLRDTPDPVPTLLADREAFFAQTRWLSTASRAGASTREFRIALGRTRQFLGVVYLSTEAMETAYWPASMNDGCRDLELVRGAAPETLRLDPSRWSRIE
jgi:hypothetical protein